MAYIEPRGKKWIVIWREDGKRHSKGGFASKKDARIFENDIERRLLQGTLGKAEERKQPFSTYARNLFESDLAIRQSTRTNYLWALSVLEPHLGTFTMEEIQPARVRAALAEIHRDKSGWTADACHRTLARVFKQALTDGLLHRNPLEGYRAPKIEKRATRILTPAEVETIAQAIAPRFRVLVLLAAWGGFRIGELGGLQRDDIDWERNSIAIRRSAGNGELGPPKTGSSHRVVTLPVWVMQELREHLLQYAGPVQVFTLPQSDSYVDKGQISHYWRMAVKRSGLEKPYPRLHDLRHTAVSILIREGKHPKLIQSRMGHASITMTMDTYGHLYKGADAEAAASLERFKPEENEGNVIEL